MRRYETIVIADPDLSEDQRNPLLDRMREIIAQEGGFVIETDEWGNRKLAYEIKKKPRGYYVRLEYCGMGPAVDELERFFKIDDRVLKFMTIVLDKDADEEAIKAAIAEAEAKAAEEEKEAESETPAEAAESDDAPEPATDQKTAEAEAAPSTETKEEA